MTSSRPSYIRYVLVGAGAWVVCTALLHWLPLRIRFDAHFTPRMAALALANSAFFSALVYLVVRRRPVAQRFTATAAIAMTAGFGDAIAMAFFPTFFPQLSADGGSMFAAFLLLTNAVIMATGLFAGSRAE